MVYVVLRLFAAMVRMLEERAKIYSQREVNEETKKILCLPYQRSAYYPLFELKIFF